MSPKIRKMVKNLHSAIYVLILAMIMVSDLVYAHPVRLNCLDRNQYKPSSPFEKNLKLLLQSISSNTSLNKGYYNSSIGNATTPRVYGQALCRGDASPAVCQNCIENASQEILKKCKSEEAIIWYEDCQIHYSLRNFLTNKMGYYGNYPESNDQRKAITTAGFDEVLSYLIKNLISEASADPSMFAVGQISFRNSKNIYGLAQCTRDLSANDCKNCLNSALGDLRACCSGREGGILVSAYCNLRYEPYHFYNASSILVIYPTSTGRKSKIETVMVIACTSIFVLAVFIGSSFVYVKCKKGAQTDETSSQIVLLQNLARPTAVSLTQEGDLVSSQDLPLIDQAIIRAATDEFSDSNKLGQGGFGTVYKGVLPNGKEVAVKRLSRKSGQGLEELKNEIILIAKLQHRNLVRLLACGIEGDEKLLIYEYMPNKSLDLIIFDPERRSRLDWMTCSSIISGIAKGLLYLHEDSRLKIIHRDLKPSNILLDEEMIAKISDFGMARIFCENQNIANTKRVVGTYGYMAPEYAMEGLFSIKSDVFSFGVILLEIISGKKSSRFYFTGQAPTLPAYAWQLWNEGKELEFVGPFLMESCSTPEVLRSVQIGLLCVQEDPASRPTMSSVVALLQNDPSVALPEPRKPAFSMSRIVSSDDSSTTNHSMSEMPTSIMSPR